MCSSHHLKWVDINSYYTLSGKYNMFNYNFFIKTTNQPPLYNHVYLDDLGKPIITW